MHRAVSMSGLFTWLEKTWEYPKLSPLDNEISGELLGTTKANQAESSVATHDKEYRLYRIVQKIY